MIDAEFVSNAHDGGQYHGKSRAMLPGLDVWLCRRRNFMLEVGGEGFVRSQKASYESAGHARLFKPFFPPVEVLRGMNKASTKRADAVDPAHIPDGRIIATHLVERCAHVGGQCGALASPFRGRHGP